MKLMLVPLILLCLIRQSTTGSQIIAGTQQNKMFQRITTETNEVRKLQMLMDFEKQFSRSKVLLNIYLMVIDAYRQAMEERARTILAYARTIHGH
jgi:hypothetical protein